MSIQGLKRFAILAVVSGSTAGCAAFPWTSGQANKPVPPQGVVGASGVVAASATEPINLPPGRSPNVVPATGPDADPFAPNKDDGFQWEDLAPENIEKTAKKLIGFGPDERIAQELMSKGKQLFTEQKYPEAAKQFKGAASRWPDSALEEDAMFLEGECYFFSDEYPKAQDAYDNTLKKYENSRHLDTMCKRLFAIGQYWENVQEKSPHWPITPNLTDKKRPRFDTFGNAIKAYETIRMKDPIGPLADDAVMATANAYFRKKRWEDAARQYDDLRKGFPRSEHQAQACLLGLQAARRMYQGEIYDGTALDEADEIAEQALTQFSHVLESSERQRVEKTRREIVEQQAARDWAMARYYDKKKCYGAARHYYQGVLKEYPQTSFAKRAAERLEEIRGRPAVPPNRFKWLTDLFPTND